MSGSPDSKAFSIRIRDCAGGRVTLLRGAPLPESPDGHPGSLPCGSPETRSALQEIYPEARRLARPWAAALEAEPRPRGEGAVLIAGALFKSALLCQQTAGLKTVFPFLASEGRELAEWSDTLPESLKKASYAVRYLALHAALGALEGLLTERLGITEISAMAPGALEEWPLPDQSLIFSLLRPEAELMGLTVAESHWLSPMVSASGIYFESPARFHNCRLCREENCPHRRFPRM
jgi:hypothetical protein